MHAHVLFTFNGISDDLTFKTFYNPPLLLYTLISDYHNFLSNTTQYVAVCRKWHTKSAHINHWAKTANTTRYTFTGNNVLDTTWPIWSWQYSKKWCYHTANTRTRGKTISRKIESSLPLHKANRWLDFRFDHKATYNEM